MTIFDLRCDRCGCVITGPSRPFEPGSHRGVRLAYHPGDESFTDNSTLVCVSCWSEIVSSMSAHRGNDECAACGISVESSLHIQAGSDHWQLCTDHAVEFLNTLLTVEPKLDVETFVLPTRHPADP